MSENDNCETVECDVLIVGAGPAGLATACRILQLARSRQQTLRVCLIEKSAHIGGHILSGAVIRAQSLDELFPQWSDDPSPPLQVKVSDDEFHLLLNATRAFAVPRFLLPKAMQNHGAYLGSLSGLCRWLAKQAEQLGAEIITGCAAKEILYDAKGQVCGVLSDSRGLDKTGARKSTCQPPVRLKARYTVFAEGCHGHLGKQLIHKFGLTKRNRPQHYALGIKEVWQLDQAVKPGRVLHTIGWPLGLGRTTGGGFLYHLDENTVAVGLITDLNYENPWLDPFQEFQRYKQHPLIRAVLVRGKRIAYGARALTRGGLNTLPDLCFPGGVLVGDNAGFLNGLQLKGVHCAIQSGMLAAEALAQELAKQEKPVTPAVYQRLFEQSGLYRELWLARNVTAALHRFGMFFGSIFVFVEHRLLRGRFPFTLQDSASDHSKLLTVEKCPEIPYPAPDNRISFDRASSVHLANISHPEDQPQHLILADADTPLQFNLPQYDEPAQRYCPAGVFEFIDGKRGKKFRINAQNCLHCKCCDIKDPCQNITWTAPQGGSGPNYTNM